MAWYAPNWITGNDPDNYQAGLEADRKRQALNASKRQKHGEKWYADTLKNDAAGAGIGDGSGSTPEDFISEGFEQGANEAAAQIRNGIGSAVSAITLSPLKLIPWNVWVILAVAVFLYFGGLKFFTKKS